MVLLTMVFTVFNPLKTEAQIIDNTKGKAFTHQPFFNKEVIRKKRIKTISGKEIHYKLGDALRETEYFKSYEFDEKGQLIKEVETVEYIKETDTLITIYEYDEQGNLVALRQKDEYGFYAYIYDYDEKGRVANEEYRRNLTRSNSKSINFELGKEYTIYAEKSSYQENKGELKRTVYNNNDIPYKDIVIHYNEAGKISQKVERLHRTSGVKRTTYFYNEKNLIDSITVRSNTTGVQDRKATFAYDKQGNLTQKKEYKNNKFITQYEVIYDEKTMLINDVLIQNLAIDFIKVLELRNYTYFFN